MTDANVMLLVGWSVLVGVDLIAGPQVMIARPLVSAIVAGAILGDVTTGVVIGVALELFAWDVLPFGAARYPDYGVAAIAGVWTAAHAPGILGFGIGVGVALITAYLGEWSVQLVRRLNTADLELREDALDDGVYAAARALHLRGLLREVVRSGVLAVIGLSIGVVTQRVTSMGVSAAIAATVVATGAVIGVGAGSGLRVAGASHDKQILYGVGVVVGIVWMVLR